MARTRVLTGRTRIVDGAAAPLPSQRPSAKPSRQLRPRSPVHQAIAAAVALAVLLVVGVGVDQLAPGLRLNPVTLMQATRSPAAVRPPVRLKHRMLGRGGGEERRRLRARQRAEQGGGGERRHEPLRAEGRAGWLPRDQRALARRNAGRSRRCRAIPPTGAGHMGPHSTRPRASARTTCENNYGFCRVGMTFCADGIQPRRRRRLGARAPGSVAAIRVGGIGSRRGSSGPPWRTRRVGGWTDFGESAPTCWGERPLWDERSPLAREGEAAARCGMNASAGR